MDGTLVRCNDEDGATTLTKVEGTTLDVKDAEFCRDEIATVERTWFFVGFGEKYTDVALDESGLTMLPVESGEIDVVWHGSLISLGQRQL